MGELMWAHLKALVDYSPVNGWSRFDMSNVV